MSHLHGFMLATNQSRTILHMNYISCIQEEQVIQAVSGHVIVDATFVGAG